MTVTASSFHDLSNFSWNSYYSYHCFVSIKKFGDYIVINKLTMADKQKVDLGLLEEDDEFEEFPAESE